MSFAPIEIEPKKKSNAQLINQDSGNFEYYSPIGYTEAARMLMGEIDLDPASSDYANVRVKALNYFTKKDDGLKQKWFGRVWMNHPFSKGENKCPDDHSKCKKKVCIERGFHIDQDQPSNHDWISKLIDEYKNGDVTEAVIITFASTSEGWFRPLLKFPQMYPNGRVNYFDQSGKKVGSVTKGSVVTYLGSNLDKFKECFSKFGVIKVEY